MGKKIIGLWDNAFIQGGVSLTAASLIVNLLNYFFHFLAGRSLGPQGYGEITALLSYLVIISTPILVFSTIIMQKIASKGANSLKFAASIEAYFWKLVKNFWFLFLISILLIPFFPKLTNLTPFVGYSLIPLVVFGVIASFYGALMQGINAFFLFSIIIVIATFLKLLGAVLVTLKVDGVNTIAFLLLVSQFFAWASGSFVFANIIKKKLTISLDKIEFFLQRVISDKQFIITLFSILAISLFTNIDIVFVKKFFLATDAGIYSSWIIFSKIILYFLGPIITVSFIFFSSPQTQKQQNKVLLLSLLILAVIGIISYFIYSTFAKTLIWLFYGNKFASVAPYLAQAAIFGSLYACITFINSYFLAKRSFFSLILSVSFPVYLILLFLIPKELSALIRLDIIFSIFVATFYLLAYIKTKI